MQSVTRRRIVLGAFNAIVMMVLFYVAALGTATALGWFGFQVGAWVMSTLAGSGALFGSVFAMAILAAALIVLWSVVPRIDRFEPPGPELTRETHPALFREVDRIAADAGEVAPRHVYLVNAANAFVAQRGGVAGLGSRRVLGIGLPLLCGFDLAELRSVLAHEFGHFCGGDTKMLPWVVKARRAMIATVENLAAASDTTENLGRFGFVSAVFRAVRWPFERYAVFFLEYTQWLSREQELAADAVGARIAGSSASISALNKVGMLAFAYEVYLQNEVQPLVEEGRLPPLADGFRRFLTSELAVKLASSLAEAGPQPATDPYDSHPPLVDRVAALERLAVRVTQEDGPQPATALLGDVAEAEARLAHLGQDADLAPIAWHDAGHVLVSRWQRAARWVAPGLTVGFPNLPTQPSDQRAIMARCTQQDVGNLSDDDVRQWARGGFLALVLAALAESGMEIESWPGEPVRFRKGEQTFEPAGTLLAYLDGQIPYAEWKAFCVDSGLASFDLAVLAAPA